MIKLPLVSRFSKKTISRNKRNSSAERIHARALRLESLESRELLSVAPGGEFVVADALAVYGSSVATRADVLDISSATLDGADNQSELSIVVTSELDVVDANDGVVTLREALDYAQTGDTITFDDSLQGKTIALELGELTTSQSITIDASNLWDATTSAPGLTISGQDSSRILRLEGDFAVEINGITFTNGYSEGYGGAIYDIGATLSLNNCVICSNEGTRGGAIYSSEATLSLDNCSINGNKATDRGGGLFLGQSEMTLANCAITNNTASTYGGGIYNNGMMLSLYDCEISGNEAGPNGGGLSSTYGDMTLVNCTVTNNVADGGGAIRAFSGSFSLIGCDIIDNAVGGIEVGNSAMLTATDCLIAGNRNYVNTVAGLTLYGNATLYNCTIVGNKTPDYGGGVALMNGTAVLNAYNTIIADNIASSGEADVYFYDSGAVANAYNTLSSFTDWTSGGNNLTYDKSKPLFTNAAAGDYTLAESSQAINKGDDQNVTTSVDHAGEPRIFGGTVDLGAYEYQFDVGRQIVVDSDADVVDADDGVVTLREALADAESGDTITFADSLQGKTIALDTALGELTVNQSLTIDASDLWDASASVPGLTISGQRATRILRVKGGSNYSQGRLDVEIDVKINGIMFTNGCAGDYGGAIRSTGAKLLINNCVICDNEAANGGGGVSSTFYGNTTLANCLLTNNSAYGGNAMGGAIYSDATLSLDNCLICDNEAKRNGGGVYASQVQGSTRFANCTVTNNTAVIGGGVFLNGSAPIFDAYNSIIAGNRGSSAGVDFYNDGNSNVCAYHTLSSYTRWSGVSNFTYNASQPLFTNAAAGDYTLSENSQAINQGDNQYVAASVDIAGRHRISGGTVDLGAYEYQIAETPSTVVTTTDDVVDIYDGKISLREALDYAESGVTITFACSLQGKTIAINPALGELTASKSITIDASNLFNASTTELRLAISGQGTSKILRLEQGVEVEIVGITFTNSFSTDGEGAICNDHATLFLDNCVICDNEGGGLCSFYGEATLANCAVTDNRGGAIYSDHGTLSLSDCVISDNRSIQSGGGIYSHYGETTLTDCIITNNIAVRYGGYGYGGAIYSEGNSAQRHSLTLNNCVISGNEAATEGGGVYSRNNTTTLTGCTITNNTARNGGAIFGAGSLGTLTLDNCNISDNKASYQGGGVSSSYGATTLVNCTVTNNVALNGSGGGIYFNNVLNAYNTIIAGNTASSEGTDLCLYSSDAVANAYNTLSSFSEWTSGENNLVYNESRQLFADAASGEYTLANHSQAVNKGNNLYVTTDVDLAGNTRIFDGTVDLGAYEYQFVAE